MKALLFMLALAEFGEGTMSPERLGELIDRYGQNVLRTAYLYLKNKQKTTKTPKNPTVSLSSKLSNLKWLWESLKLQPVGQKREWTSF